MSPLFLLTQVYRVSFWPEGTQNQDHEFDGREETRPKRGDEEEEASWDGCFSCDRLVMCTSSPCHISGLDPRKRVVSKVLSFEVRLCNLKISLAATL